MRASLASARARSLVVRGSAVLHRGDEHGGQADEILRRSFALDGSLGKRQPFSHLSRGGECPPPNRRRAGENAGAEAEHFGYRRAAVA